MKEMASMAQEWQSLRCPRNSLRREEDDEAHSHPHSSHNNDDFSFKIPPWPQENPLPLSKDFLHLLGPDTSQLDNPYYNMEDSLAKRITHKVGHKLSC